MPGSGGLTTTAPATLGLSALEHAENLQVLGGDGSLIHVAGSILVGKVILENKRKAYGDVKEYKRSCRSEEVAPDNPEPSLTCTSKSFEEYAMEEYGDVDFEAEPATPVHFWISDDFLVHRVVIGLPGAQVGNEPAQSERYFEVSYSDFNEMIVTAPK